MRPIVLHAKVKILIIKKYFVFVNVESHCNPKVVRFSDSRGCTQGLCDCYHAIDILNCIINAMDITYFGYPREKENSREVHEY